VRVAAESNSVNFELTKVFENRLISCVIDVFCFGLETHFIRDKGKYSHSDETPCIVAVLDLSSAYKTDLIVGRNSIA